jgi:hypothetical protein
MGMAKATATYRTVEAESDLALQKGLSSRHKRSDRFFVKGKEILAGHCMDLLAQRAAAKVAVGAARRAFHDAVQSERRAVAQSAKTIAAVRMYLAATLADGDLFHYGIAPRKKQRRLSDEQRLVRAMKIRATRAARKTLGSRQRRAANTAAELARTFGPQKAK